MRPTILSGIPKGGVIFQTEIFGPVMGLMQVENVDEAIQLVNNGAYGNMACLFTQDGAVARRFRYQAQAGNIGINIGWPRPWHSSPLVAGRTAFLALCMVKAAMQLSSTPKPRWLLNVGRNNGPGSFNEV